MKARSPTLRNVVSLLFPLAIVACAQLQGLDDYEKVDCVDEGCSGGPTPTNDSGGGGIDVNQPDTAQPATCPPCDNGTVCDQKSLKCVECLPGTKECAAGYFCDPDQTAGYKCVLGCGTVQDCLAVLAADGGADADASLVDAAGGDGGAGTLACCNNRCVDTASDGKNCGACNVTCGGSAECCASNCQDVVSTPTSCGGCGITCSANHIPQVTCGARACNGTCETGWGDCNTNKLTDGCETDIATNPDKCGGCNVVCSNSNMATRTCGAGQCNGTCSGNFRDCNNNKQTDGCEIDIGNNAAHCGACNNGCSNINVPVPTCLAGACNGACAAGYSDCDNQKLINGCETKTSGANADPNNCGGCGASFSCSSNNMATRTCDGTCTGNCATGFADCFNGKLTDGCETNIYNDASHCGGCNQACSGLHVPTPSCGGTGQCNGACESGWADCNTNKLLDGCETRTGQDSMHCTGCGGACNTVGMRRCVAGACTTGKYGATTSPGTVNFIDACALGGMTRIFATGGAYPLLDDEVSAAVTPFGNGTFNFFGVAESAFYIGTNGWLVFGGAAPANGRIYGGRYAQTCPLPDTSEALDRAILWVLGEDLMTRTGSGVCYATQGVAPNRQQIITWKDARFYDQTPHHLTFSVILTETTNTIDIVFDTMNDGGNPLGPASTALAYVGVQKGATEPATTYQCNAANVVAGTKVRFYQ